MIIQLSLKLKGHLYMMTVTPALLQYELNFGQKRIVSQDAHHFSTGRAPVQCVFLLFPLY